MSTATAFLFPGSFPFCVQNIAATVNSSASNIANLSLADVMAFAWNLETFTLTTVGNVTSGALVANGNITFTMDPIASNRMTRASHNDGGMWFGASSADIAFASWPRSRVPRSRICNPTQNVAGTLYDINADDNHVGGFIWQNELGFWVGTDPLNAGKYRLYYRLSFVASDPTTQTIAIEWDNRSSIGGVTAITNGNVNIAGQTFNWYSYKTTGTTHSGTCAMTATSTSYTYP